MTRIICKALMCLSLSITLMTVGVAQATPIKLQPIFTPTASSSYPGNGPERAFDGNTGTSWTAAGGPTQWIQLDLGKPFAISKIQLVVGQNPNANTTHVISVGQDPSALTPLTTLSGYTYDGQSLTVPCNLDAKCGGVRYIRITTTSSPSWVSWKEIEVYQALEFFGYFADAVAANLGGEGNNMNSTAGAGANIVMIGELDRSAWVPKLQQARALGVKAVLYVYYELFANGHLLPADVRAANWAACKTIIDQYRDVIAAFYIQDEPYDLINADHSLDPNEVAQAAALLKSTYSDIPNAVIIGLYTLRYLQPSYISMFDWVGFDCYGKWDACYGFNDGVVWGDQTAINKLNSWLSANQRRIAVPGTYVDTGWTEADVIDSLNRWNREVINNNYAMTMAFRWATSLPYTQMMQRAWQLGQSAVHTRNSNSQVFAVSHSASSSYPGTSPFMAFDSITSNMWNSGGPASAWIAADFGGSTRLTMIDLLVAQNPTGNTTHVLERCLKADPNQSDGCKAGSWKTLKTFQSSTGEGTPLYWTGSTDATGIRVRTTSSPSWVAWHDITFNYN